MSYPPVRPILFVLSAAASLALRPPPAFAAPVAAPAHQPPPTATVIGRPTPTVRLPVRPTPTVRIEHIPVGMVFLPLTARLAVLADQPPPPTARPSRTRTPRPTATPFPTQTPTATPPTCPRPWRLGLTVLADGGFDLATHPCDGLTAASAQRDVAECPLPPMAVTVRAGGPDGAVLWSGTLAAKPHDTVVLQPLLLCVPPPYHIAAASLGPTSDCWTMCPGASAARTVTQADFDAASASTPGEGRTAPIKWSLSRVSGYADSQGPPLVYLPALRAPVEGTVGTVGTVDDVGDVEPGSHMLAANDDLACTPSITLVNAANDFVRAVFVAWPAVADGGGGAARGPSTVFCTEPLKPGVPLTLDDMALPADFDSAYVVSLSMRAAAEAAAEAAAGAPIDGAQLEGTIADHLCRQLQDRVVGDPAEEARFRRAFLDGTPYAGLRLDHVYGGPLAVQVSRACPRPAADGAIDRPDSAAYNGPSHRTVDVPFAIAGDRAATPGDDAGDATATAYRYPLPAIIADSHRTTVVHIQNADVVTNTFDLSLVDEASTALPCARVTLPPGASRALDVASCTSPGGTAAAAAPFAAGWVTASGPAAIVVDIVGEANGWPVLASYTAPSPAGPLANIGAGVGERLAGPLLFDPAAGNAGGAELFVQNVDPEHTADVTVTFFDRAGDEPSGSRRGRQVAPGGRERFILRRDDIKPGDSMFHVRITSGIVEGGSDAAPIAAVVLFGRSTSDPFDPSQPLVPTAANALGAIRDPRDGTPAYATRTGRLVLPVISNARKAGAATGPVATSSIAIINHVDKPGFTDLALMFFDRNGLLDFQCLKLNERQTEYIDLATWGFINSGFKGSVLISAVFWEHDVFTADGTFVGNILDLGAAAGTVSSDGLGREWTSAVPLSRDGPTFGGDVGMADVRLFCGGPIESRPGPGPGLRSTFVPPALIFGRTAGAQAAGASAGSDERRRLFLPFTLRRTRLDVQPSPTTAPPRPTRVTRPTATPIPFPTDPPTATPPACPRPWRLGLTVLADGGFDLAAHPCDGLAAASAQREVAECPLPPMDVTVRAGGPDGAVLWIGVLEPRQFDTAFLLQLFFCVPPPYHVQAEPLGATTACWAMCPGTAAARAVTQADFDAASAAVAGAGRSAPIRWSLSRVFRHGDTRDPALVYVPALGAPVASRVDNDGGDAGDDGPACIPTVTIVNVGAGVVRVALIAWRAPSADGRIDAKSGPTSVECTQALRPGVPVTLDATVLPSDAASAYVVSMTTRPGSGVSVDGAAIEGSAADYLCRHLSDHLVGDAAEETRFRRAFLDGSTYAGLRLDQAYGGPLAAHVSRDCPRRTSDGLAQRSDTAAYNALSHRAVDVRFAAAGDRAVSAMVGVTDTFGADYRYPLPAIVADGHRTTVVHVQNADLVTNTLALSLVDVNGSALPCADMTLPPGQSLAVDLGVCTAPGNPAAGAAPYAAGWVSATGPAAIVVDIVGTADGWPELASYAAPSPAGPLASVDAGIGQRVAGPLLFDQNGADNAGAELYVQNADLHRPATVTVQVFNGNSDEMPDSRRTLRLAPGGRDHAFLALRNDGVNPADDGRYLRATSDAPAGDPAAGPGVAAVLILGRTSAAPYDPGRPLRATAADALSATRDPHDGTPEYAMRTGRVVLPLIERARRAGAADGPVDTTQVAITNHVDKPGFTDLTMWFFDRNGMVDFQCLKLNERQTEHIDLATQGFINEGFRGSVLISAWFWEHDVYDADGLFVANLLDLGAASGAISADGAGWEWTSAVPLANDASALTSDPALTRGIELSCSRFQESRPAPQPTFSPLRQTVGTDVAYQPSLASANRKISSAPNTSPAPANASSNCATVFAPMIGAATFGWASSHASATWAHVAPCAAATASRASRTARPRSFR